MNCLQLFLFVGATQVAGYGLAINQTEVTIFQEQDDRLFVKPYPFLVDIFGLDPEATMSTIALVQHRGYPIEVHTVTTQDNYILTMHRIPYGKNHDQNPNLDPILLVHGTFGFDDHWLVNTPENSFAYLLADAGFDVWLANLRGTEHSRLHMTLSARDPKYWQFSFDEMAQFDIPAFIDRILAVTGHSKVFLSGHSLGAFLPIGMLSVRPEYNTKVKAVFALAPLGNLVKVSLLLRLPLPFIPLIRLFTELLGIYELPKSPTLLQGYLGKNFEFFMRLFTFLLQGPDYAQWDSKRLQINAAHLSSTMALNILYHEAQIIKTNRLQKFDWGRETNLKKYNQTTPPDYDLSKVTVLNHLYYGENDWFCSKENVEFLDRYLPNSVLHKAGSGWNHIDHIWGKYAGRSFFNCLVSLIQNT